MPARTGRMVATKSTRMEMFSVRATARATDLVLQETWMEP
jgi:hypothetical protein